MYWRIRNQKSNLDDIDCMIKTLYLAKRELGYAVVYESERNILNEDQWIGFIEDHQQPSGTIIREGLKQVSRVSRKLADEVVYGKEDSNKICRGDMDE